MKQKFIAFKMKGKDGNPLKGGSELIFTFPEIVVHRDMKIWCDTILDRSNIDSTSMCVSSAGFVFDDGTRYGESESLGINAKGVER